MQQLSADLGQAIRLTTTSEIHYNVFELFMDLMCTPPATVITSRGHELKFCKIAFRYKVSKNSHYAGVQSCKMLHNYRLSI